MVPVPGGSGRGNPPVLRKINFHGFPFVKCSVLQREAFGGPNHHPNVAKSPSYSIYVYIYIYICMHALRFGSGPFGNFER